MQGGRPVPTVCGRIPRCGQTDTSVPRGHGAPTLRLMPSLPFDDHIAVKPPSTDSSCPVTNEA
jgi:hypothetical protein